MKIGIYLSGLGEGDTDPSVEKYARRFARQYDFANPISAPEYQVHVDKFEYDQLHKLSCNRVVVSAVKDGAATIVYKFYEYKYAGIMTRNFRTKNALLKSLFLFIGVCSKMPLMLFRLFWMRRGTGYQPRFRGQALYLFILFFIVSLSVLLLLPAAVSVVSNVLKRDEWLRDFVHYFAFLRIDFDDVIELSKWVTSLTAVLVLLKPRFNDILVSLACEFVSASDYLERGSTKQTIHGQLDMLVEQIVKTEGEDTELYLHSFSFGSLVCLDYVFPYGVEPSCRLQQHLKGLVTIGSPIDFVKVYFPKFFTERRMTMNDKMKWINVYSLADALGSNFRHDDEEGEAAYSFDKKALVPLNVRYEVTSADINIISQFFTLYAIKSHGSYWDVGDDGQTCFRNLIPKMKEQGFL